jgi:hypothetical protein
MDMDDQAFLAREFNRRQLVELSHTNKINMMRDAAWVTLQAAGILSGMAADFHEDTDEFASIYKTMVELREHASMVWKALVDKGNEA